jgi:Rad3-related DNA helicase
VGLLVLGGAFSEGIDLVSDRLIGVALVGIGLPQIGHDNNLIRDYHQKLSGQGFEYAYMDPGMNKVMQAVGRLIRSESDKGAALLIDDRYLRDEYRDLFIRTWTEYDVVLSPSEVSENLSAFYKSGAD